LRVRIEAMPLRMCAMNYGFTESRPEGASLEEDHCSPRRPAEPAPLSGAGLARRVLAREVEERRFFLWIPVAAMGGVALNLSADREPVLWRLR
jgi:hypothetical protein